MVTGASRGIGRAIAQRLATHGCKVAINFNSSAHAANELVQAIARTGGQAVAFHADVSDPAQLTEMVSSVRRSFGEIDILINNAGFVRDRLLLRMTESDWTDVWNADFDGSFRLSELVLPGMAQRGWGRVVNISSVVGIAGNAGQANYAAAKGAIVGMTRDLAVAYAKSAVTVNCIAPGYIHTDATAALDDQYRRAWLEQVPMGRWGDAEEIAAVVGFLASDDASYITGRCIVVDGGLLASDAASA
jgi:3-oxoacyl-[acyl-carrier protein] reductase